MKIIAAPSPLYPERAPSWHKRYTFFGTVFGVVDVWLIHFATGTDIWANWGKFKSTKINSWWLTNEGGTRWDSSTCPDVVPWTDTSELHNLKASVLKLLQERKYTTALDVPQGL